MTTASARGSRLTERIKGHLEHALPHLGMLILSWLVCVITITPIRCVSLRRFQRCAICHGFVLEIDRFESLDAEKFPPAARLGLRRRLWRALKKGDLYITNTPPPLNLAI